MKKLALKSELGLFVSENQPLISTKDSFHVYMNLYMCENDTHTDQSLSEMTSVRLVT